jgi:NTE family protein
MDLMAYQLPEHEWSKETKLVTNVVDAENGEWTTFDRDSGVSLLLAVAASSAVPGVYPPTTINGRRYIDGGMSSGTNSDLAKGQDLVLILVAEPTMISTPIGPTMHRIAFEGELKELKEAGAQVMVITPDEVSLEAKGPNPLNARQSSASAKAGREQGRKLAKEVKKFWE